YIQGCASPLRVPTRAHKNLESKHAPLALDRCTLPKLAPDMATSTALQISQLFVAQSWRWRALFLVMLLTLHFAAMWGVEDAWARGLMLVHFGVFILWQPFMRGERRLTPSQVAAIAAIALGTLYFLNWWLLALWVSVLAGIVGGKVFLFQARWLRRFYLVVLLYLVSLLLVWIVPNTFIRVPL